MNKDKKKTHWIQWIDLQLKYIKIHLEIERLITLIRILSKIMSLMQIYQMTILTFQDNHK